jgi:DUF1680 family protein
MASADDGLVAAAYAPCEVRTRVHGTTVQVSEQTEYPFRGTVRITVNPESVLAFALRLRIPAWASGTMITVNGQNQAAPQAGTFAKIERTWKAGDVVEVKMPLQPRLSRGYNDSASIERGSLVFAYPIGEDWVKLRDRGMTADWQVFPSSQWNYALAVNEQAIGDVTVKESTVGKAPFTLKDVPVSLQVEARKVPSWRAVDGVADPVPQSPVSSEEAKERIALVPYAAAKLRITAFPEVKS